MKWIQESPYFGNSPKRILPSSDLNFLRFNSRWIMVPMIIGLGWSGRFLIRRTRTRLIVVLKNIAESFSPPETESKAVEKRAVEPNSVFHTSTRILPCSICSSKTPHLCCDKACIIYYWIWVGEWILLDISVFENIKNGFF